jgi:hypothetical protein
MQIIQQQLTPLCGDDPALGNRLQAFCSQYETVAIDVTACLDAIGEQYSPEGRTWMLELGRKVAGGSGHINAREAKLLERAASRWGVPSIVAARADDPIARIAPRVPAAAPSDPRAVLEIDSSTPLTAELIRRQFHLLSERFAAQKVESLGREFVDMARAKQAAIRQAAEALLRPLGEPLEIAAVQQPRALRENPDLDAILGG